MPSLPVTNLGALPVGTPESWLRRRPDIVAAERQMAAALIGVARSELFTHISLSGLLGLDAATFGALAYSDSRLYPLGAALAWTPFDFGAIRSRIKASEARALGRLASYEQAVAAALEETEGAFSGYTRSAQRAERLLTAATSAEEAAQLFYLNGYRFNAMQADATITMLAVASGDIAENEFTAWLRAHAAPR